MLIAFEGTGTDAVDRADFSKHNGFMFQFVRKYKGPGKAHYVFGPGAAGLNVPDMFEEGKERVEFAMRKGDKVINIVGYSRGGFVAMALARYCSEQLKVSVPFLGLFDCVSRASTLPGYDQDSISAGVKCCYHAMRNPSTGSRSGFPYFGNTGQSAESGVKFEWDPSFTTSHSGMGGWPLAGDITDPAATTKEWCESTRAGLWMTNRAMRHGLLGRVLAPVKW